jgi:methionyl-tRNA synthetase
MVTVEGLRAIDLRIGTIVAAEPILGTDRLLRIRVDLGAESREVVAGIAGTYGPQDLVGVQAVLVANIAPATIRGVRSEGMLLGVGCEAAGDIALLTVNRPVSNGARVQ